MKRLFIYPKVIQRMREGPIGAYIDLYVNYLIKYGFSKKTSCRRVRLIADFSRWLERKAISIHDLDEQIIDTYLRYRKLTSYINDSDKSALRRLLRLLREIDVIDKKAVPKIARTQLLTIEEEFTIYLRQERRLSDRTIVNYIHHVKKFIAERFGNNTIQFNRLCPKDITEFVQRFANESNSSSYSERMTTALRIFLRYLWYKDEITTNLALCVPSVAKWRLASLPKFINPDQVQIVLQSINRQTSIGKRNYAIMLLLSRLGLRAGEIVALKIEDIDWENGVITILGKNGQKDRIPIPHDVGKAIAIYLKNGRPNCSSRRVFVRHKPPICGFKNYMAISTMVHRALERVGIGKELPYIGAHLFRHTLATEMLQKGFSLGEVGEILRHQNPNTTAIYAKVDINALKSLSKPWPREV
jgi:site-specific recombinase XerD